MSPGMRIEGTTEVSANMSIRHFEKKAAVGTLQRTVSSMYAETYETLNSVNEDISWLQ